MYRLLIVDDEPNIVEGIRQSIDWEEQGIAPPLCAFNGIDALEQCRLHPPDIVITDIKMPGMDGLKLSAHIRELSPHMKIIILSAFGQFDYAREAISLKINSYLLKPIKRKALLAEVVKMKNELDQLHAEKQKGLALPAGSGEAVSIHRIQEYIQTHIMTKLSLNDVAGYMSLSPSHLSRLFHKKTGTSFISYVKQAKIERAKYLLETTNLKVYEICDSLSYQNLQHFTALFKSQTGMTPLEYKRKREQDNHL
jgi:two-component system response regulator YesN